MIQRTRIHGWLWLIGIGVILGCSKSDGGGSPGLQPVAAQHPPKNESAPAKEDAKSPALAAGGTFRFPDDDAGKILGRVLPPSPPAPLGPLPVRTQAERTLPGFLAAPDATTLPATMSPKLYPQPSRIAPRPVPLPDRVPLDLSLRDIERPESITLPVGALTRISPLDVKTPSPLPILARPTPDRASLEDPTAEFTARSILNDNLPLRVAMAMFVKVNLPNPFENVEAAKVNVSLPEDPAKVLGNPPLLKP